MALTIGWEIPSVNRYIGIIWITQLLYPNLPGIIFMKKLPAFTNFLSL